jgi:UDP-N-acetylmuramate: L-alanyl-gamma-D-glutamyl-meso-diaminopimelate ligase
MINKINSRKIHFIGIAGVGMSALAVMLKKEGNIVTGSDEGFYEPALGYLKKHDIPILSPHKKENIPTDADLIVIGKHAKLTAEDLPAQAGNEEVRAALNSGIPTKSFPEVLAEITADRENIIVAGSYGKSTCAALLSWCLLESGIGAGYFFGAVPIGFAENAHMGEDKHFVIEGDEYPAWSNDGSTKSKFLYLNPKDLLLTSCEHDHVNIFPTLESYLEPYKKLVTNLPADGLLIAGINNPNVKDVVENSKAEVVTYGIEDADWYPENIKYGQVTTFDLCHKGEKIVELSTSLLGTHNIENIVGVAAFLLEKKLITPEQLKKIVKGFKGIKRRLDLKAENSSVLVYEGFGSSYTKAKTVFDAIKLHFPSKKIITIFEPHTFSWRNKNNLEWYKDIFKDSDETLIFIPPEHGGATHDQATHEEILSEAKKYNKNIYGIKNKDEALEILEKTVNKDDLIILMSSGDLGGLIEEVPVWAEQKFPR